MPHTTDLDLTSRDVAELASPDAIASFFARLGYDTARRTSLSPEAIGLSGETAGAIKRIETLSEDSEQFLRVVFCQSKSLTARSTTCSSWPQTSTRWSSSFSTNASASKRGLPEEPAG